MHAHMSRYDTTDDLPRDAPAPKNAPVMHQDAAARPIKVALGGRVGWAAGPIRLSPDPQSA